LFPQKVDFIMSDEKISIEMQEIVKDKVANVIGTVT
jgi:hypothetical protein